MNINDIAKLAGVSASTVSKVINKKDQSISEETRQRVLKIVNEYNYSPYSSQIKNSTPTGVIGILINSETSLKAILSGLIMKIQKQGFSPLVLNNYNDSAQELKNITNLVSKRVDGIIWEPTEEKKSENKEYLLSSDIPIVVLGEDAEFYSINHREEEVAYFLTEQLIHKNHKKIACIIDKNQNYNLFLKGYRRALFDNNLAFEKSMIISSLDEKIINSIINEEISGFISSNFYKGVKLYHLAKQNGLQAPENYSLVSIQNDSDFTVTTEDNSISTCKLNTFKFGSHIADTLINLIVGATIKPYINSNLTLTNNCTIGFPSKNMTPKILVIGSINIDTYLYSSTLPHQGTTNFLTESIKITGGKGFNQAVGVVNLGQRVKLISCLGSDLNSNKVYQELDQKKISSIGVSRSNNSETGQAYIFVESAGNSTISVLPGANYDLSPNVIEKNRDLFTEIKICLIQTEIPIESVKKACSIAKQKGIYTFLKPSGVNFIPDEIFRMTDFFIPNEDELLKLYPNFDNIEEIASDLLDKGVKNVIVTRGKKGCFLINSNTKKYYPSSNFQNVDSTGASDAFISALAVYLLDGYSLDKAIQIAIFAAGFSIAKGGVADSLVDQRTLQRHIAKVNPKLLQNRK